MDKHVAQYSLETIKKLLKRSSTRDITRKGKREAASLGYMDEKAMIDVILNLGAAHFYKSMTTYADHKVWQDVYKVRNNEKDLYIKLQISPDDKKAVIVQFKEDSSREA